ncbi:uncharacterized protein LOC126563546 [Anopheles maculipalpis]|uniref:uncharacterized protein LOC126563546 n=1 Tax=Anopheles maculipalpis TaxID=1496333 RepID=UPI002158A5CF|nr:uncharacterized protein LOC126563546 [Anopheles maculipalpis]
MAEPPVFFITVKGSASNIREYMKYSIHSILFLRGVHPGSDFVTEIYNGVPFMVSRNAGNHFIDEDLSYIQDAIMDPFHHASRNITYVFSLETMARDAELERWEFQIMPQFDDNAGEGKENPSTSTISEDQIQIEILDIMRQILEVVTETSN